MIEHMTMYSSYSACSTEDTLNGGAVAHGNRHHPVAGGDDL